MATIKEIYNLSVDERADNYNAEGITSITIDGNEFTGYKAFSFIWEKTFQ
jgi:hypothetical protein